MHFYRSIRHELMAQPFVSKEARYMGKRLVQKQHTQLKVRTTGRQLYHTVRQYVDRLPLITL